MESAINQPHPDEADEFFGSEPTADPDPGTFNPENGTFDNGLPTLTPEAAAAEAASYRERTGEPEPEPEAKSAPEPAAVEPEPAATPEPAPAAATTERSGGQLAREYIVFQKVPLTVPVLQHLIEQINNGTNVRTAYFEVHRATTRTDRQAIGAAHAANREALGDSCDLAAVTARGFKERHVEPEEVPAERRLKIT